MWYRYTILPALSLNGILELDVYTEALTVEKFNEFIEHLLHHTMEHSLFSNMYNFFQRSDQGINHNAY